MWGGVLYDENRLHESRRYDITDIFMGALIYGLLSFNEDDQKTLDFVIAASCLNHTIKSDYNQVSKDEVFSPYGG